MRSNGGMEPLPIVLPAAAAEPPKAPLPLLAAAMPVLAGVVLWLITGSLFSLCFAALGPVMMVASLVDSTRGRRKERRRLEGEEARAWAAAEEQLGHSHREERRHRSNLLPDAATSIVHPPLRGSVPPGPETPILVGRGDVPSGVRTTGGEHGRAREFQERARVLVSAPTAVPLGAGVCLRGPLPVTTAVARALVLQICLRFRAVQTAVRDAGLAPEFPSLPKASMRKGLRISVTTASEPLSEADAAICLVPAGGDVPDGITTVVDVVEPGRAILRTPDGVIDIAVEGVSREQFGAITSTRLAPEAAEGELPDIVGLDELEQVASGSGLPATIGSSARGDRVVDIVEDGPHAIVTGTTGTGKSELLVTWVAAMAAAHGPERVTFVLADFKGGTAFEPLRDLPHVVAVITDLDEHDARRGVSSLRAELRRRESVLAAAGVRDIRDAALPRLVIVVDEFAALLQDHPDLGAVFTDIAARGRALGMHLILGTQRAAGVVRDALAANCPLRLTLRLSDPADSRAVIGSTVAAELPGGPASRGLCLVRRPQDDEPEPTRIALTRAADLRRIADRWRHADAARSPWLPPLPVLLPLDGHPGISIGSRPAEGAEAQLVWGLADDPESQSQPELTLRVGQERGVAVIGAPGTGRTTALRVLSAQHADALWMPSDLEGL